MRAFAQVSRKSCGSAACNRCVFAQVPGVSRTGRRGCRLGPRDSRCGSLLSASGIPVDILRDSQRCLRLDVALHKRGKHLNFPKTRETRSILFAAQGPRALRRPRRHQRPKPWRRRRAPRRRHPDGARRSSAGRAAGEMLRRQRGSSRSVGGASDAIKGGCGVKTLCFAKISVLGCHGGKKIIVT